MTYIPKPFDTSSIPLDENIGAVIEQLAKNTHETWAAKRISQGWKYGPEIDEKAKTHSSLVKYEELPESEKELDRVTVIELLKVLLFLGYCIEKSPRTSDSF